MGLHFSCPIDMWAAATSLYELYTGKIMFAGHSNNQMLKLIMEVKGKMPHKLIRKGVFSELHFDPDYDFLYKEKDRVTGREIIRLIKFEQRPVSGHDMRSLLTGGAKLSESEGRKVAMLADLLDKATTLDPSKRLTPSQALRHPFCDLTRNASRPVASPQIRVLSEANEKGVDASFPKLRPGSAMHPLHVRGPTPNEYAFIWTSSQFIRANSNCAHITMNEYTRELGIWDWHLAKFLPMVTTKDICCLDYRLQTHDPPLPLLDLEDSVLLLLPMTV
eukprot:scaffold265146_cov29-Tisochrysis_lutea.AAC.3